MRYGEEILPRTTAFYREYISGENLADDISAWRLFDFLLFHLPGEITVLNPEEMEKLVDTLDVEATRAVSELYAGFNAWMQKKLGISGWQYRFEYRKKREETEAYTVRQFSSMAYCLFNEEWWKQQGLLEKSCESAAQANLRAALESSEGFAACSYIASEAFGIDGRAADDFNVVLFASKFLQVHAENIDCALIRNYQQRQDHEDGKLRFLKPGKTHLPPSPHSES